MPNYVYGKNATREALLNNSITELYLSTKQGFDEWINLAMKNHIKIVYVTADQLNKMAATMKHQGIIGKKKEEYKYYSVEDIINSKNDNFETSLIVMLDCLEDPHNLGAVLRSADAFGVDGVIIPSHRSVKLNETVAKVSTGAIEYVKVAEVTNLTKTVDYLKTKGYWIVGAEMCDRAIPFDTIDYNMNMVLIIGSEGKGISRLLLEQCDYVSYIPMYGHVNSLNASLSCGIMLSEINKGRKKK